MTAIFIMLAVVAYLALLVDWKELIGILGQGGWASVVVYAVLTVMIIVILNNPDIPNITPR
ncbi:hypothetical protein [Geoalkalibacter halelectricus]|uniref:Uncharacterized protein n=1 Tax=Geoalkalibacter halelectricus TaxID=2847045 RepID=A0ABY5ZRM4_9BACT|nr:hypothetical protein [Geoalkalibacter halelectricus]MDO3378813.1 hypothetical protein [Geoalkalibacter halelectricus]UWZ79881.1 hypothetical protein L9S41_00440 [Geoalkalibacter halelectricus]